MAPCKTCGSDDFNEVLNNLQMVGDDHEADLVERLAIAAGYWWKCSPDCGVVNVATSKQCGVCRKKKKVK